jgi:phenylacetate-coenzyme A ligase PaaK-like adenylate-forming protein
MDSQLLAPPRHSDDHWARLVREVGAMVEEVPLYAGRAPAPSGSSPEAVSAWLGSMPTVQKRDLRRGFPKALVRKQLDLKAEMARGAVEIIATSGTTENRLQVLWEWSWWDPQEREAMRLNARIADAMKPGAAFREAVLTTPVCGGATCHVGNLSREERFIDGMLFLNQVADPTHWGPGELDRMIEEWNELRPDGVETDPAYLAHLCRYAVRAGKSMHSPAFVTLTYELATRGHRRAIAAAISSPQYSLYGATETGVLFMECAEGRLHHNTNHSHIELVEAGPGLARVLITTLGRTWMPLLRYDVSDVVAVEAPGEKCRCGRDDGGYLLKRVEGRVADCSTIDGRLVTPAQLDDAVEGAEPLDGWQLVKEPTGYTLRVVGGANNSDGTKAAAAVSQRVQAQVVPRPEAAILPEGSGKYRLVRPA